MVKGNWMNGEPRKKPYFVGVRLTDAELNKLEGVMDLLEPLTGERNLSNALRYMIRHFDVALSPLGKVAPNEDESE
jgi:hypothetical protein